MPLSVDVVIPVSGHWELTESCLRHLAAQTREHRVIVGDNGSTDATAECLARQWPSVQMLRTEQPDPFAVVCNAGAAAGSGDVIVLLNNDVDCRPDFLEQIVAPLEREPELGSVAALCVRPGGERIDSVGITCDATLSAFARLRGRPVTAAGSGTPVLTGPAGSAAAYRRVAWAQVGGLDEAFPAYHEDFELALRLRAAGWSTVAAPGAVCTHLGSATHVHRSASQRRHAGFGRGYVMRRYGLLRGPTAPRTALTEALVVTGDALVSRDLAALRGRLAGWRVGGGAAARAQPRPAIDFSLTLRDAIALRRGTYDAASS
jgi:GT2 family glycosyltransferase